jgi:hypothetical protein
MKNTLTILFMIISTLVSAQGLDFGLKLGFNFANVSGIDDFEQRTGLSAGIFAGARLGDKLGLQVDALYSQQGAEVGATYSDIVQDFNLDYISIPVVVKYYLTDNLNIHAGPQIGILLNDETSVVGQVFENIEADTVDWLGTLGIGLDLPLGLRAEARYSFGLTRVNGSVSIPSLPTIQEGRTRMTTLSIGYSWL